MTEDDCEYLLKHRRRAELTKACEALLLSEASA